ncbi:MAG: uncharacterized protein KVP18_005214, partial [Porospora cf. gigantea A]|uniref:uncharacterized protein n=1 Tax=Porospora cf. gigantea A TaxID=2853593 RepID=UPI00355A4F65
MWRTTTTTCEEIFGQTPVVLVNAGTISGEGARIIEAFEAGADHLISSLGTPETKIIIILCEPRSVVNDFLRDHNPRRVSFLLDHDRSLCQVLRLAEPAVKIVVGHHVLHSETDPSRISPERILRAVGEQEELLGPRVPFDFTVTLMQYGADGVFHEQPARISRSERAPPRSKGSASKKESRHASKSEKQSPCRAHSKKSGSRFESHLDETAAPFTTTYATTTNQTITQGRDPLTSVGGVSRAGWNQCHPLKSQTDHNTNDFYTYSTIQTVETYHSSDQ